MYAIIVTGGKQYKVEEGASIYVEKLDAKEGVGQNGARLPLQNTEGGSGRMPQLPV